MTNVVAATSNKVKLVAIKEAFQIFKATYVVVEGVNSQSNVDEQPFDEDVMLGAKNRMTFIEQQKGYDFYVACEGGVVKMFDNYYNMQIVVVKSNDGKVGTGISSGLPIPKKYIEKIKQKGFAKAVDEIFDGNGGTSKLTSNFMNRGDLIKEATVMALTQLFNDKWEE